MKILRYIKNISMMMIALSALILTSCDDDETSEAPRLFRPVDIELSTSGNKITAEWVEITGATSYAVELYENSSKIEDENGDSYNNKILVASDYNVTGSPYVFTDLEYDKTYYFRIRANSADESMNSRFTSFESIKTGAEPIILTVSVGAIDAAAGTGTVTFAWESGYSVSNILLTFQDGTTDDISITDSQGSYTATGLALGSYTATIRSSSLDQKYNTVAFEIPILVIEKSDLQIGGFVTMHWWNISGLGDIKIVNASDSSDSYTYNTSSGTLNSATNMVDLEIQLATNTTYNATIYLSDGSAGNTVKFTTLGAEPAGYIEVSNITELKDAIANATSGSTIGLRGGAIPTDSTYKFTNASGEFDGMTISKSLTFMAATGEQPIIYSKQIKLAPTTEEIEVEFNNIHIDGTYIDGSYLFNVKEPGQNIKSLKLQDCTVTNFFCSLLRADNDTNSNTYGVLNFIIDNCEMYNINGKQGVIAYRRDAAISFKVETISITNSTIAGIGARTTNTRMFIFAGAAATDITIANNTFVTYSSYNGSFVYNTSGGAGEASQGSLTVTDNIFYNYSANTTSYVRTPALGTLRSTSISNNCVYQSWGRVSGEAFVADTAWDSSPVDPGFPTFSSTTLWNTISSEDDARTDNWDLTVTNSSVIGKAQGDPRWLE